MMKVVCVDDEHLILQRMVKLLEQSELVENAKGFLYAQDLLDYMQDHKVDAVFSDIDMPDINGLKLASIIREKWPETAIIFLTAYKEFAVNAFEVHANGYLLKPVEKMQLEKELQYLESILHKEEKRRIRIQTFGNFEVICGEDVVKFARKRAKEILAYLVCKKGTGVSRAELAVILWEDQLYDHGKQKQLDVYIRSMISTLRENNLEDIMEMKNGLLRIRPEKVDCDYYRYCEGEERASKLYTGEFMSAYSWAEYMKPLYGEK